MPTLHRLHQVSIQYIRLHPGCCSNRHWNLSTLLLHVQHLSIHQSTNPSIRQSVNPSVCQSINLSIHQSVNPSIHQSVNPSISEECPYCDTRTLVGDNPARWFCSTTLLNSLVQVRQPGHIRAPAESVRNFPIQWNPASQTTNSETQGYRLLHFLRLSRIFQFCAEIFMTTKNHFNLRHQNYCPINPLESASQGPKRNRYFQPYIKSTIITSNFHNIFCENAKIPIEGCSHLPH